MQYDPIKRTLGVFFNKSPFLRKIFYKLLDLLLLRAWHIKKEFNSWAKTQKGDVSILDAGSGFGQYVYFMSSYNKNWMIKGIDVKDDQIEDCSKFFSKIKRNNVSFETADLLKFSEEDKYKLVLSVDVMEHILEDVEVFKNLYRSLKEGGMLLISTPSDQGGSDVHDHDHGSELNDGTASFIDEHVRDGYNIDEIREKLKKAGFSKTEARYSYGKPGKISWRLSMKYPILMLGKSKIFFIILPFYYILTFPVALICNYLDVHKHQRTGTGLVVKAWK
ncbi:MAG: class I SAM-dependent methyltransferase [Bacteroidales bacterium]|nr:class I SAM-dependent methyltransferase [Bacteroidales bacterium]